MTTQPIHPAAMSAAEETTLNVDKVSAQLGGPRFAFIELIQEQAAIITRHFQPVLEELAQMKAESARNLAAKHALSDAYLRIRQKLNAFDTPFAPTLEQIAQHTEAKLDALQQRIAELEAAQVFGFYEEGHPIYTNRKDASPELSSPR